MHPFDKWFGVSVSKDRGQPCKPGETAASDGCIPQGDKPASPLDSAPGVTAAGRHPPRSTVDIMEGLEKVNLAGGRRGVPAKDVAKYLNDRGKGKGGVLPNDNPKSLAEEGATLADEAEWAYKQDKNALGWYAATLREAMDTVAAHFPELKSDKNKRSLFKIMLAITSQGQGPTKNMENAVQLYREWRTTGRVLTDAKFGGPAARAINGNLKKLSKLIEKVGFANVGKFLMTEVPMKTLVDAGFKPGGEVIWLGKDASGKKIPNVVHGSNIFGPKIGAFYSNLNGDFSPVTMDRWFMRTIGRVRGTLFGHNPELLKDQAVRLRRAILRAPNSALTDFDKGTLLREADILHETGDPRKAPALTAWAKTRFAAYQKDFAKKSEDKKAAKMYLENLSGLADRPTNAKDRVWLRKVVGEAQSRLKAKGINLNNADMQALLWYYEKNLWAKVGYKAPTAKPTDYATAAKAVFAGAPSVGRVA